MTEKTCAVVEPPLAPTWARYVKLFIRDRDISIYRAMEYELLSKIHFQGRILDVGGGEKAHYRSLLGAWGGKVQYESVNLDEAMNPTYLGNADGDLGVPAGAYDMVVCFNTLEHIYDIDNALTQILRAAKLGGRIILAVPFLFRVHASPHDYNRPTAQWWIETLERKGVRAAVIEPIVWDIYTSGLSVTEGQGIWHKLRRIVIPLYGLLYGALRGGGAGERYRPESAEEVNAHALGYVISWTVEDPTALPVVRQGQSGAG